MHSGKKEIVVALAGNPNSGKTTIFNALTGARQHVGNYPGVTVECKEGVCGKRGARFKVVDLPGTYSLTAYSEEERAARNFIIEEKPDVVVDVLDASNIERNLYLAVQLRELGVPLVLVFNMSDTAAARGYTFDIAALSRALGAPIVQTVGNKGKGIDDLCDAIIHLTSGHVCGSACGQCGGHQHHARARAKLVLSYGSEVDHEITQIASLIKKEAVHLGDYDPRWLAIKLLENDAALNTQVGSPAIARQVAESAAKIERALEASPETAIAGRRYDYIADVCQKSVRMPDEHQRTWSDKIDSVLMSRLWGIPIFLGLMYLVFHLTFTLGEPMMAGLEGLFEWLGVAVGGWWPAGSESLLKSLLVDGIIGGVGGVLVFVPNILLLFLAIAFLEDSGYMARAAFIMDRLMHQIGLHGKSFIPMLIGFGCSIPAIMATRTLENRRDRLTTMMVIPLMSCGARLPIYALIIPAFFPQVWHAPMLWMIYIIGILLAIVSAKILRLTLLKGESVPFVMELPPYRMPLIKGVLIHMWERGWLYLKKAGTIILGISIVLWVMITFPGLPETASARFDEARHGIEMGALSPTEIDEATAEIDNQESEQALKHSIAGRVGRGLEPVIRPMGFDWKIGTALIGAFAAKEVFVAQMGIVHAAGETDETSMSLRQKIQNAYTPLIGFCIMLFCLISVPCMATIAVTRRESGSWKWALFQLVGLTLLAYGVTVLVYQIGLLFL